MLSNLRLRLSQLILISCALLLAFPASLQARGQHPQSRPIIVVLDPGHGGSESGAVDATQTIVEKNVTLRVALAARTDLRNMGYTVYLTRTRDQPVNTPPRDLNHDNKIDQADEFTARNLVANRHHADIFVSIHFDASTDPSIHGTHGYYCPARSFWKRSTRLASLLTASISSSVRHAGYDDPDNGVQTDVADVVPQTRKDYPWFLVLGPSVSHFVTGTVMPGALIETMYLSSPRDAGALRQSRIIAAIGRGYATGIHAYFGGRTSH